MIYAALSVFVSTISAQDTLTVAQMQEDFNYMIEQYERIHTGHGQMFTGYLLKYTPGGALLWVR